MTPPSPRPDARRTEPAESGAGSHPFLAGLKPEHLRTLDECKMKVRYEPGETIFREGDPANRFYLIDRGRVALESRRDPKGAVLLQHLGPGDVLGWSWLFPPYVWQFDARAVEPTEATFYYGTRLREHCEEDHDLGFELLKRMTAVVIRRLQAARERLLAVKRSNEQRA
jgi:CRP-like cAMP-binding protein